MPRTTDMRRPRRIALLRVLVLVAAVVVVVVVSSVAAHPTHPHPLHHHHGTHAHTHASSSSSSMPQSPLRRPSFGPRVALTREWHNVSAAADIVSPPSDPVAVAVAYARSKIHSSVAAASSLVVTSAYRSRHTNVTHVHLVQTILGLEVYNAVANVNVDAHGNVISFASSFYGGGSALSPSTDSDGDLDLVVDQTTAGRVLSRRQGIHGADDLLLVRDALLSPIDALAHLVAHLNLKEDIDTTRAAHEWTLTPFVRVQAGGIADRADPDFIITVSSDLSVPAKLKLLATDDNNDLAIVWDLILDHTDSWWNAHIAAHHTSAHTQGDLLAIVDWVADAQYEVLPLGTNDPLAGPRAIVTDPAHPIASPAGWHTFTNASTGSLITHNVTVGNNVWAHENLNGRSDWVNNKRPSGGDDLTFIFPVDYEQQPVTYLDAAVTNLFYWNNIIHDLFYLYGFDEVAGNFQESNDGKGGRGGDAVNANAQDGSGRNNANFATPPDGSRSRMRMYVWDVVQPMRDGDLEGGIIMHEYAHGISTRLTGGPANSGCLGWGEAGGMGEGWGDFFATILRMTPSLTRDTAVFGMGDYSNGGNGIRYFPYSTSLAVNPSTYAFTAKPNYWGVHAKGEVWAVILYEVYWNMVDALGFEPDWYSVADVVDFDNVKGNILTLQYVVDGLKLQPCTPSFVDARDAILLAERTLTAGRNACLLWRGFAKRGLGVRARAGGKENFEVPEEC